MLNRINGLARWGALAAMGMWVAGCGNSVTLFGPDQTSSNTATGGSGGGTQAAGGKPMPATSSVGGQGGQSGCRDAADCNEPLCFEATCNDSQCGTSPLALGTPCGTGPDAACDGQGACLLVDGSVCATGGECLSGFCADGVCCDKACTGTCRGCARPGDEGRCIPHAPATDPDVECAPGGTCDGAGRCASGSFELGESFGGDGSQYILSVVTDSQSNVIIAGAFFGSVDFGGGGPPFLNDNGYDLFVAKFDSAGKHLFSKQFFRVGTNAGPSLQLAVGKDDEIIFAGGLSGTVNFDGNPVALSGNDVFVSAIGKNGGLIWHKVFVANGDQRIHGVSTDANGNIFVGGRFNGTVDFGGAPLTAANYDGFVAKFDRNGVLNWAKNYGATQNQFVHGVDTDGQGNVFVAGYFYGTIDFGLGPLTADGDSADGFVAKLDTNATALAQFKLEGTGYESIRTLSVDPKGRPAVSGVFDEELKFGHAQYTAQSSFDHHVLVFDGMLTPRWSKQLRARPEFWARTQLKFDGAGHLLVGRTFVGTIDDGGMTIQADGRDAIVTKFSRNGTRLWSSLMTGPMADELASLSTDPQGATWVVGSFLEAIDLGGGTIDANGNRDGFMVKLSP